MKLTFAIDKARAIRSGVDIDCDTITIEINPADLTQPERDLLADLVEASPDRLENSGLSVISADDFRLQLAKAVAERKTRIVEFVEASISMIDAWLKDVDNRNSGMHTQIPRNLNLTRPRNSASIAILIDDLNSLRNAEGIWNLNPVLSRDIHQFVDPARIAQLFSIAATAALELSQLQRA